MLTLFAIPLKVIDNGADRALIRTSKILNIQSSVKQSETDR